MAIEYAKQVRVDDTLEMGYYIDDCTDPWTTPETIILVPGCRKPRQGYYAWIPTLARHFRVIRPHMRGHWDSTLAPKGYQWTVENLILDLKNFLDALGVDKVHYVGENLGGFLGYYFAYHYPERLKTMTLATVPTPNLKHHPVGKRKSLENHHPGPWGADEKWKANMLKEFGPENRDLAEWHDPERWKCPEEASKGYFKACISCEVNEEEFLGKISVPTLYLLSAEYKALLDAREAQRFCNLMQRAKLVTFPGVSAPCQFVVPEKCAQEVVRFIREQG